MSRWFRCIGYLRFFALFAFLAGRLAMAQAGPGSRITGPINDQVRVTLRGNTSPLAQARYDQGPVADSFPAERMLLILQRPPEREAALRQFIQDAHTPGSPSFHRWLAPEQFGELYGPDDSEVAAVTGWLQTHGFSVARVTKGKTAIEFSGSAGQVRAAFHTEIHAYLINGELHHANSSDPQIPAALAPVIAGITPMNDFRPRSYMEVLGQASYDPKTHKITPQWTIASGLFALAPGDFAVQYDLNPLYAAGTNGTGVIIGIIGASDVDPTVVATYRSLFGLPPVNFNAVIDGSDPGEGNWATGESYLDVEVSSAVAPGATIDLYTAADTSVQSGLLLAAQRAVDDDQASVLSTSYGTCEQDLGSAGNQFWATLWEQAVAQGQTSFVSAGDSGSAGCDDFNAPQPAQYGLAVSGFSSTPWNISVGGTDFFYTSYDGTTADQNAELATYWDLTPTGIMAPATSLLRPIPEQPWNRAFGLNLYDGAVYDPTNGATIVGGSGGASSCTSGGEASDGSFASCTGGYAKPAWQSGKGVPSDRARDIPDVSLFAADGENDSFYPICAGTGECTDASGDFNFRISAVGGTSASSPEMAGIMALINQKFGRQGQANYILYPLAAEHPSVFHDVAVGSNNVPCDTGTPNCTVSALNDNTKGDLTLGHYYATAGYDEATGLGSVDANLLLKYWDSLSFTSTSTTLSLSQTTFTHGTPVHMNVAVSGNGGTPSGDVGLFTTASPALNTGLGELTLQDGSASTTLDNLPGGQYQLIANYTGDTIFAPSNSTVSLDVAPENSTISVAGNYWNSSSNSFMPLSAGGSYPYGTYFAMDAQPIGVNAPQGGHDGIAAGTVSFTDAATTGTVNSGVVNILVNGIAEWQSSVALPVGTNHVSASYSGDPSFNASTTATPLTFTVSKAQTYSYLYAKPSPIALGSATTLTLNVGAPYSGPACGDGACTFVFPLIAPPTGTVTFSFGTTVLGTVAVDSVAGAGATDAIVNLNNITSLPLGTDTITAAYSGDANYNSATASFNVVVEQSATLSASANPSSVNQAEFTEITATVTGANGLPIPTGTVNFFAAGPGSDWTDTETLTSGSATSQAVQGGRFLLGGVPVTVSYYGDSTYGPAAINVSFTVTPGNVPPFSLSGSPISVAPGATTGNVSSVTATPEGGFTGAVYLSCALTSHPNGAKYLPTCSIPPSINISGTTTVTASMTVNSTAPASSGAVSPWLKWHLPDHPSLLGACTGAMIAVLLVLWILAYRRGWRRSISFLFIFAVLWGLAACGGGGSGEVGGGGGIPGTTPGIYAFTVSGSLTANGVAQAQTTVTVTIQ